MAEQRAVALADPVLAAPAVKVLESMQTHWDGLTVFVDHPWIPMDNNTAEPGMRGPVVGRKNFYGSGSQWSGQLAAGMYSLDDDAQTVEDQCAHLAGRLLASVRGQWQPRARRPQSISTLGHE